MIDYVLVVAVGISAGAGALVSALPSWQPHTLEQCLAILALISIVNLRGTRDVGVAFLVPTYFNFACLFGVIVIGLWKTILSDHASALEILRLGLSLLGGTWPT